MKACYWIHQRWSVAVCDRDELYWNKAAERITGWASEDVVGHRCLDNILCHIDKDGVSLCGKTPPAASGDGHEQLQSAPVIVFGKTKSGKGCRCRFHRAHSDPKAGRRRVESFRDFSDAYLT